MTEPEHYNPLFVTVLPRERRARHAYQLSAMALLFTLGAYQLLIGVTPNSAVKLLDIRVLLLLNWFCVIGGAAGIAAAMIPERVVRVRVWRRVASFDATWFRLFEELASHLLVLSVWASYGFVVWASFGLAKGYSLGIAASLWFGIAAMWRIVQILGTIFRAGAFSRRRPTALVGPEHDVERRGA